jgi:prevent-host-death family protein
VTATPSSRPISDLRNKTQEISKRVHQSDEPVFITKNGLVEMVVMRLAWCCACCTRDSRGANSSRGGALAACAAPPAGRTFAR